MKYGNCLVGACVLLWNKRKMNPKFILRYRPNTYVPHFMVKTEDSLHHYRVKKNILPWPLCYIIFQGRFQSLPLEFESTFHHTTSQIDIEMIEHIGEKVYNGKSGNQPKIKEILWKGTASVILGEEKRVPALFFVDTKGKKRTAVQLNNFIESFNWVDARLVSSREWDDDLPEEADKILSEPVRPYSFEWIQEKELERIYWKNQRLAK